MIKQEPRVLIVSNNSFSKNNNNGKTLASFFSEFDSKNIAQLYFTSEIPSGIGSTEFFRITDIDVLKSFNSSSKCGRIIEKSDKIISSNVDNPNLLSKFRDSNILRLFRELMWKFSPWKSNDLDDWIQNFSPDIIFFCAGDSGFAYRISNYIHLKYDTKLIIYVTDDYILPRKTMNIFWWLRRNYIYSKIKYTINDSDLFITISEKMRFKYKEIFNKDSILAINMTESLKNKTTISNKNTKITLVYTGGLHFKRDETLSALSAAIEKYNNASREKQLFLKIYSNQTPSEKTLKKINTFEVSKYCGSLNKKELMSVLNRSDIPVHVESFDRKSIESTRLSISTKIPEYLSLGKPILAIGPGELASLEYLEDVAYCITNPKDLFSKLCLFVEDKELQNKLSKLAFDRYKNNHNKKDVSTRFKKAIYNCYKNKEISYD